MRTRTHAARVGLGRVSTHKLSGSPLRLLFPALFLSCLHPNCSFQITRPRDKQSKPYFELEVYKRDQNHPATVKKSRSSFRTNNRGFKATSGPWSHPCDTLIVVFLQQMFVHAPLTSAENSGCERYYSLFEMHSCTARTSAPKQEAKTVAE